MVGTYHLRLDEPLEVLLSASPSDRAPSQDLWQAAAQAANFDDDQQAYICTLINVTLTKMRGILQECQGIPAQIGGFYSILRGSGLTRRAC